MKTLPGSGAPAAHSKLPHAKIPQGMKGSKAPPVSGKRFHSGKGNKGGPHRGHATRSPVATALDRHDPGKHKGV